MKLFQPVVSGTVVVCCPHDQVKRRVTELPYDARTHKAHLCACCENLFLRRDDVPHYCSKCSGLPVYPLGGPIPDAIGEV